MNPKTNNYDYELRMRCASMFILTLPPPPLLTSPFTLPDPYPQAAAEKINSEDKAPPDLTRAQQRLLADSDSDAEPDGSSSSSSSSDPVGHSTTRGGTGPPVPAPRAPAVSTATSSARSVAESAAGGLPAPLEGAALPASVSVRGRRLGKGRGGDGAALAAAVPPAMHRGGQ